MTSRMPPHAGVRRRSRRRGDLWRRSMDCHDENCSGAGHRRGRGGADRGLRSPGTISPTAAPAEAAKPTEAAKPAAPAAAAHHGAGCRGGTQPPRQPWPRSRPRLPSRPPCRRRRQARPSRSSGSQLIGKLEGPTVITRSGPVSRRASRRRRSSPSWSRPASCRRSSSGSARTRWSSSRSTRSASTAAPGVAGSPARATTATAPRRPRLDDLALLGLHRQQDRPEHRQGLGGRRTAAGRSLVNLRRGMKWWTASRSRPTTSCSGSRTCTRTRSSTPAPMRPDVDQRQAGHGREGRRDDRRVQVRPTPTPVFPDRADRLNRSGRPARQRRPRAWAPGRTPRPTT